MKVNIFRLNPSAGFDELECEINEFIKDKDVLFVKQSESACVVFPPDGVTPDEHSALIERYNVTITVWYEQLEELD